MSSGQPVSSESGGADVSIDTANRIGRMEVRREMERKILVSVQGGVTEVCEETVPAGIAVEILDFDNFDASPERELSLWSPELREYWAKNHAQWIDPIAF